jgi:hypothetical protein
LSYGCLGFAVVLSILTLTVHVSPTAPAYLTFLFTGLLGSFAGRAVADLDRRIGEVERRR